MGGEQSDVNRDEWATIVRDLMAEHGLVNESFAARCGVSERTVRNWLKQRVPVSEESVRKVARAFNLSPRDLLVRVGYYSVEQMASTSSVEGDLQFWVKLLQNPDVPDSVKRIAAAQLSVARRAVEEFAQTMGVKDIG